MAVVVDHVDVAGVDVADAAVSVAEDDVDAAAIFGGNKNKICISLILHKPKNRIKSFK